MSGPFVIPESERQDRIAATEPGQDVWVSANAGSGKTTILRDRVIRLLLDGVAPDRILCLTYTKAAAAEMQGRIFAELARWVRLDDGALAQELARLAGRPDAGPQRLARARTLFAHAIETPGGLKIQTIHAFAERTLHLFPLEAGVPLNFEVVEAAEAKAMRLAARRAAVALAIAAPASKLGLALAEIVSAASTDRFEKALDAALEELSALRLRDEPIAAGARREALYRNVFGIEAGLTTEGLEREFRQARPSIADWQAEIDAVLALGQPGSSDGKALEQLRSTIAARKAGGEWTGAYLQVFLTGKGEPRSNAFTKGLKQKLPGLEAFETGEKAACAELLRRRRALVSYNRSIALLTFAEDVLERFEAAKRARALLDFNDLIAALRRLLARADASWIMMKLDGAIEHVLIDEAQDTTREMWDIVRALTSEFFAGEGLTRRFRSLFVVGDEKQSIFSFQGADPAVFEETRLHFAGKSVERAGPGADPQQNRVQNAVQLRSSFRSSADVLAAVDQVFASPARAEGLAAVATRTEHSAARTAFPGLAELWPIEYPEADGPSGMILLSRRIADRIADLVGGEGVRPGEVLVLVQKRGPLFHAILKALKQCGVPVSGADRLKLQAELAIRDLLVTAEAALTPEDDLALATALKSPLFGLDENGLERLARNRSGSLFEALGAHPEFTGLAACWRELVRQVRQASPFEFFAGLLNAPAPADGAISGRRAIYARLGSDVGEPLDAFLLEAQGFTGREPGSTLRFVLAQRARESELKRDFEQGTDKVRVMTVHGAKGLEARIVFLADATGKPDRGKEKPAFVLPVRDGGNRAEPLLVWSGGKDSEAEVQRMARGEQRHRTMREYRRLLYVGMTRAAERLYVAGFSGKPPPAKPSADPAPLEESWHRLVGAGFREGGARAVETEDGREILRVGDDENRLAAPGSRELTRHEEARLPDWLFRPLPSPVAVAPPLRPSAGFPLGDHRVGADAATGLGRRQRGIFQHRLYEVLPGFSADQRVAAAESIARRLAPGTAEEDVKDLVEPVLKALEQPDLAWIFGAGSRGEVSVAGEIVFAAGHRSMVSGRIDRLIVGRETLDIVDIKTGRERPAVEDAAILHQMALYRALLARLQPAWTIRCHVLWGDAARLETLPSAALDEALESINVNQE